MRTVESVLYTRVSQIDPMEWGSVVANSNRFLCLDYLSALEESHDEGLELRYVLYRRDNIPIGAAAFQITHFTTSEDAYSNPLLKAINVVVRFFRGKHIHNILICGNAIATGEHGFSFPGVTDMKGISLLIVGSMKEIAAQEQKRGKRICAMVIKDFYPDTIGLAEELTGARFQKFQVDHNMVMPLLAEWTTFNHYLEAMITKFRTKAKSALNKSASLEVKECNAEEALGLIPQMEILYDNVYQKADFRLGKLNLNTIPSLLKHLPENFTLKTYSLNNRVVGFLTAMRCGTMLEAHVIGIDYDVNKEYAVYQKMLYDYVELAIVKRCNKIVFGRTAAEIKSTIGAFPVDLTCCVLHQRRISNHLLSLILQYVKPSEYPQRQPYKADVYEKLKTQSLY